MTAEVTAWSLSHGTGNAATSGKVINQADTEFLRVRTEFHREDSWVLRAADQPPGRSTVRAAPNSFSVKLCAYSVQLCDRLISCLLCRGHNRRYITEGK